jgi:predicted DNA-binding antitoxin AbrB/MazE fold protein
MTNYPNLLARYSKGTLKLRRRLRLPEGAEVRVSVMLVSSTGQSRRARRKYRYPNRPVPPQTLRTLAGLASLGGDALVDSEALYDSD